MSRIIVSFIYLYLRHLSNLTVLLVSLTTVYQDFQLYLHICVLITNNNNRICYKIKPVNKDDLQSLMFELIKTTSKCQIIIMRPTIKYPTMSNLSAVRCILSKHHVSFVWQNVHIRFSMSHMFSHSYILVEDNRGRMELRANV